MKQALLIGFLGIFSLNAQHCMQSEEAKRMEADYQKNKDEGSWLHYWQEVKRNAQNLSSHAINPSEQKSYETIILCARFLETHVNYFTLRNRVNQIAQGIDENELGTVAEKGLDHPLCQRIEKECGNNEISRKKLNDSALAVERKEYIYKTATWGYWGYGWLPTPGYYDSEKRLLSIDPSTNTYQAPDADTLPEPDVAKRAEAILACQKCYERDAFIRQLKQEYDDYFLSKENS